MDPRDDLGAEVEVTITALRKPVERGQPADESKVQIRMREHNSLDELWGKINAQGYEAPSLLKCRGVTHIPGSMRSVMRPFEEIIVVADNEPSTKNQVRQNETLISHSNTHYGEPIEFNIKEDYSDFAKKAGSFVKSNRDFKVSFERTPRMPDDNRLHQLPASLGSYDLFNVGDYADRLPENIGDTGGVFLAMWQREAMWINFGTSASTTQGAKWAVRIFIGRINAVSGLEMDDALNMEDKTPVQDYVVIPGQEWLDGICVAPGIVRQFVAMPLGSGYTVEGQKTSEEKHGGLQIELIPEFERGLRWWVNYGMHHIIGDANGSMYPSRKHGLNEMHTPAQLGLKVGDVLLSYPRGITACEPFKIQDLIVEPGKAFCQAEYHSEQSNPFNGGGRTRAEARIGHMPSLTSPLSGYTHNPDDPSTWRVSELDSLLEQLAGPRETIHIAPVTSNEPPQPDYYSFDDIEIVEKTAVEVNSLDSGVASLEDAAPQHAPSNDDDTMIVDLDAEEVTRGDENDNDFLDIKETTDLKTMGLAAGGKLIQDIYTDPYPPNIWNHAAARILHIHILDPTSFEKVTHIVPVPPPMSAEQYAAEGGQFFVVQEKLDERLEGGDFNNIKSVSQMDKHVGVTTEPEFDPTKPKECKACSIRLCDCIIRPCDHQFCNICIKKLEKQGENDPVLSRKNWKCPTCGTGVARVAGFSAPMNLPGEEPLKAKVPVNVLKIEDGRVQFASIQTTRL